MIFLFIFLFQVSIAIGGWGDSQGSKYGPLLTDANKRQSFANSAVDFLKKYNFDGLDLDMEVSKFNLIRNPIWIDQFAKTLTLGPFVRSRNSIQHAGKETVSLNEHPREQAFPH